MLTSVTLWAALVAGGAIGVGLSFADATGALVFVADPPRRRRDAASYMPRVDVEPVMN
jgi:hypothetical protein